MGIDEHAIGSELKKELHLNYPVRDEITGEIVSDPDGLPIAELEAWFRSDVPLLDELLWLLGDRSVREANERGASGT